MGVEFDTFDLTQAVDCAMSFIKEEKKGYVVTPNPEIVYQAMKNDEFRNLVNNASLVLPDGIGIIYAAKILGENLNGRVAGIDFASSLMQEMAERKMRLFLLGAKPWVAEKAAQNIKNKYSGIIISGTKDGYFKNDEEAINAINSSGADVLFVCLGALKQEKFMNKYKDRLNVTLSCGLGGSLDVFAGNVKRAPDIFIKLGLEWFYRLCKEPKRIGRMMKLPLFMLLVIRKKIFGR